jgi:hypothetical protein
MATRWDTAASTWLEDETSGQFALQSTTGLGPVDWQAHARGRLPDCAHLLGASLPTSCACAAIYPEGFSFCPTCGAPLERLAGRVQHQPDWWGAASDQALPRHVPHGLPVTSLALGDRLEGRPAAPVINRAELAMPAPPNAHCVFIAGSYGFPEQRLLALAPARGVLQYWDPLAQLWHVMGAEDAGSELRFSAGGYNWLPSVNPARGEVGIVPLDTGLSRLWINPVNESYRLEVLFAGRLVSSPGLMRRQVGCLFVEDGVLQLLDANADFVNGTTFECPDAPTSGWMRPIGYDNRLFWLHAQGQLVWRPGEAPRWTPWPRGWTPKLDFGGPTQSRDGRLWHIGHDGQAYSFLELGAENPQVEPIDGARLGFANFLFRRGHPVLDQPWSAEHIEDIAQDDSLVLPLLRSFNNNRSQPSGLVLRFHTYTGRAEEALAGRTIARTTIEWIGKRNLILDEVARLARPLDCVPFVYAGALWLHHPDWNTVRGWRLEALP